MSMIGKTLGNFSCTDLLGKGGMGEVYKARDQKLGRDVAIKVLPEEFAKDTDRVARFQREAKLLASLNHPNIAAIHGLEESDGTHFLVLELIEGDTLADRLKRGAIPVEESLKLALQIAEALEAAHEKGVIHRDLKPANINVTPDGNIKVLDFGLAKAFAGEQAEVNLSQSPTLSEAATLQGVILGTAAYMSPEQARGETVDKKADIWAFGCVLFEMFAGSSTFAGRTVTDVLASVIKTEPEWKRLPNLHPRIRLLLERCLEKEPKNRCHDIADVRADLQKALADPTGMLHQPVTLSEPRSRLRTMLLWAASLVLVGIIAAFAVWYLKPTEPKRVVRFEYELPAGRQVQNGIAVSPDGSRFAYGTAEGIYLRSVDVLEARLIPGTDKDSVQPFFSPDGQWLGYFSRSDQKLKKVAISGGAPVILCDIGAVTGGMSWDSEEAIVYSDLGRIVRVSANGGTPETLVKGSIAGIAKEGFPTYPQMLPDGKSLLFTNVTGGGIADTQIVVQSLKSGERKVLLKGGMYARYLPTGHIVYTLTNNNVTNYFAVPFDLDKLEVTGGPVSVLEGIAAGSSPESGTLVYVPQPAGAAGAASTGKPANTLVWVNNQGKEEALGAAPDAYQQLKISPDGTKVALAVGTTTNADIWIWDIPHKTPTKLTFEATSLYPLWTPDGKRVVFYSLRGGGLGGIYWKSEDGIGEDELLGSKPDKVIVPWSFSRDGKALALIEQSLDTLAIDIGMMSMEGNREIRELLHDKQWELDPQISPDGRYLAYQSDESGKAEIYVRSFPDMTKGKWQVSRDGGGSPLWSPDRRELFYRSGDATMAVEVETEPTFKHGNPKILFRGTYLSAALQKVTSTPWDISPDGKRFLMIKPAGSPAAPTTVNPQQKIIVVLNWFEELKERVPLD